MSIQKNKFRIVKSRRKSNFHYDDPYLLYSWRFESSLRTVYCYVEHMLNLTRSISYSNREKKYNRNSYRSEKSYINLFVHKRTNEIKWSFQESLLSSSLSAFDLFWFNCASLLKTGFFISGSFHEFFCSLSL
jgi:hypothetical protein